MHKRARILLAMGLSVALAGVAHAGDLIQGDLAKLDIPSIDKLSGEPSKGTLTIGWFGTINPKWLDPLTAEQAISTSNSFKYFIQDGLLRASQKGLLGLSLADKLEVSADYKTFAFRLRDGVKFQDGTPVTSADLKWTYENYSGVGAKMYHDLLDRIETPDERTFIIHLKQSTPDFLYAYSGSSNLGNIGWVVPQHYYEKVGADGYLKAPMGAGPFKFVSQEAGASLTLEAFADYWRGPPGVAKIVLKSIQSPPTGLAGIKTGELDYFTNAAPFAKQVKAEHIRGDNNLTGSWLLLFPNYEDPKSPFHDKRVREAVSLALNRDFLNVQGTEGNGIPWGNWVVKDNPEYVELPVPEFNIEKAKQLMAEAGYANGLDIDGLFPFFVEPKTGERFLQSLAAIGIRGNLIQVDGPKYFATVGRGQKAFAPSNSTILMLADQIVGPASQMTAKYGLCDSPSSFVCDPDIEQMYKDYTASVDPDQRDKLSGDIQKRMIGEYFAIPTYVNSFLQIIGPRVLPEGDAADGEGYHYYWNTPLTPFPYPWEEWKVKD